MTYKNIQKISFVSPQFETTVRDWTNHGVIASKMEIEHFYLLLFSNSTHAYYPIILKFILNIYYNNNKVGILYRRLTKEEV